MSRREVAVTAKREDVLQFITASSALSYSGIWTVLTLLLFFVHAGPSTQQLGPGQMISRGVPPDDAAAVPNCSFKLVKMQLCGGGQA